MGVLTMGRGWIVAVGLGLCVMAAPAAGRTGAVVVVDAGHGGKDPGTQRGRVKEKAVTVAIAKLVAKELKARGVKAVLTRSGDSSVSLQKRVDIANARDTKLFVSIHCDSNPLPAERGFSILVSPHSTGRASVAGAKISRELSASGVKRHSLRQDDRGLMVLHRTEAPAVLIEVGFLSNTWDAAHLNTATYQKQVAHGIALGVVDYLAGR